MIKINATADQPPPRYLSMKMYVIVSPPLQTPTTSSKKPDTPHANDNTSSRAAHTPQKAAPMRHKRSQCIRTGNAIHAIHEIDNIRCTHTNHQRHNHHPPHIPVQQIQLIKHHSHCHELCGQTHTIRKRTDIINETHTSNQRHRKQEPQILKPEERAPNPQRQQENNPPPLRTIDECDER